MADDHFGRRRAECTASPSVHLGRARHHSSARRPTDTPTPLARAARIGRGDHRRDRPGRPSRVPGRDSELQQLKPRPAARGTNAVAAVSLRAALRVRSRRGQLDRRPWSDPTVGAFIGSVSATNRTFRPRPRADGARRSPWALRRPPPGWQGGRASDEDNTPGARPCGKRSSTSAPPRRDSPPDIGRPADAAAGSRLAGVLVLRPRPADLGDGAGRRRPGGLADPSSKDVHEGRPTRIAAEPDHSHCAQEAWRRSSTRARRWEARRVGAAPQSSTPRLPRGGPRRGVPWRNRQRPRGGDLRARERRVHRGRWSWEPRRANAGSPIGAIAARTGEPMRDPSTRVARAGRR